MASQSSPARLVIFFQVLLKMLSESNSYEIPRPLRPLATAPLEETRKLLSWAVRSYGDGLVLASSLGPQSLILLDVLHQEGLAVRTVLLDTGMLFDETILLKERVEKHFGIQIESVRPRLLQGDSRAASQSLWRRDPDQCCAIRKVEPLKRVLNASRAWITGIRRDQSASRSEAQTVEWDSAYGLIKVNPLVSWTRAQVMDYLEVRGIPTNPLLHQGYPSVGCRPCTSRVTPGANPSDERAGRWVGSTKTECGLHPSRTGQRKSS